MSTATYPTTLPTPGPAIDGSEEQLLEISMGPQHPSTHGVFRMNVVLDGERVVKLKPSSATCIAITKRSPRTKPISAPCPTPTGSTTSARSRTTGPMRFAVEKLAGIQVPERAEYLRVITGELTRLQNHACLIGFLLQDMGASGTPLMYAFREREKILDLFEALTGSRMMCNYMRFGGCRVDMPAGWLDQRKESGRRSFRVSGRI